MAAFRFHASLVSGASHYMTLSHSVGWFHFVFSGLFVFSAFLIRRYKHEKISPSSSASMVVVDTVTVFLVVDVTVMVSWCFAILDVGVIPVELSFHWRLSLFIV